MVEWDYHMFIIPTTQAQHLGERLKRKRGISVIVPDSNRDGKRYFPDGEVYAKIPEAKTLRSERVVVLHAGQPNPNGGLVELELILQILKDWKIRNLEVFFSYFPYGMQDKVFGKGETNAAENLVEKLIRWYGVKKIYVIDAHFQGQNWAKKYPLSMISALPLLQKAAQKDFGPHILFCSPDKGGKRRTGIQGMEKKRQNSYSSIMRTPQELRKSIKSKVVAVVDDLLETGGTLERFFRECKKYGAKKIIALVTHGVLRSGIHRTKKTYAKLYLTNTIKRAQANVDVTKLIKESLLGND